MQRTKRPRLHAPKLRVTKFADGRMKTIYKLYKPQLLQPSHTERRQLGPVCADIQVALDSNEDISCSNSASYSTRKQKAVDGWVAARDVLHAAMTLSEGCHRDICVECNKPARDIVKCVECGPSYWACEECAVYRHELSPLHSLKIWKVRKAVAVC